MAILVEEEKAELYEGTKVYEVCVFCRKQTKFWHMRTNNPVCTSCAKTHKVAELHNWKKQSKSV